MGKSCCQTPEPDGNAHNNQRWRLILWIALIANAATFVIEIVAGVAADSRALQADALDFFGDAANYAISLGVAGLALSWRAKAALVKAATMLVFGLWVIGYAVYGLVVGSNPAPQTMGMIGTLALVVNVFVALITSIAPPPDSSITGAASWARRKSEKMLRSKARRKSRIGMSNGFGPPPPALLTSKVMPPNSACGASTTRSRSSSLVTSHAIAAVFPPALAILAAAFSAAVKSTSLTMTAAPADANISAIARPMPAALPVTSATWPSSLKE